MSAVAPTLEAYFTERLIGQRRASPNTVAAYRDAWRLLLGFVQARTGKAPNRLDLADLDAGLISAFLEHLETERRNTVRTRNARLAAIRSFFHYAALRPWRPGSGARRGASASPPRPRRRLPAPGPPPPGRQPGRREGPASAGVDGTASPAERRRSLIPAPCPAGAASPGRKRSNDNNLWSNEALLQPKDLRRPSPMGGGLRSPLGIGRQGPTCGSKFRTSCPPGNSSG